MEESIRTAAPALPARAGRRSAWLAVPIILGVLSTLTAGYFSTLTPAQIVDGDRVLPVSTHQTTIGAALREAGITLLPEDVVSPGLDSNLNRNDAIVIKRAITARVVLENQEPRVVRTQSRSARQVLTKLGVSVGNFDLVTVDGQFSEVLPDQASSKVSKAVPEIRYRQAVTLKISDQGQNVTLQTTGNTVGEALMQAGRTPYLADRITPPVGAPIENGMAVTVVRAKPVNVVVDGRRLRTRTHSATVGDVLTELNVVLYDQDFARPALGTPIADDMEIRVVRVKRELVIVQDIIPFDTRYQADGNLELDNTIVGQEGAPGIREKRTLLTLEDGAEVKRELVADFIAREVQPRIYKYGTKIVVRNLDTPNGPVQYWRTIRMWATSYSASTAGVSRSARNYGIVRCGIPMRKGIVAVDPSVIPLRTYIYVDGYGEGYACDTGGAIQNKRIDLGYDDDNLKLWRGWVTVYQLAPPPAKIQYLLDPEQ